MEFTYTLQVVTSARELERQILKAIAEELNKSIAVKKVAIQGNIRAILERAFKSQPEYISLQGGKLQAELGVVDAKRKIDVIIEKWIDSILVDIGKVKILNQGLKGNISLSLVPKNFNDVLDLPEASYITDKGVKIEWLRWLLLEGDKYIVRDYQIGIDRKGKYARTGLGKIMIPSGRKVKGWRVPSEFSGTASNNFATRALLSVQEDIDRELFKVLK